MNKKKVLKKNPLKVNTTTISPKEYAKLLEHIKTDILQTQLRAALSVTKELTLLYWRIGKELALRSSCEKWGTKIAEKLALDLQKTFPGLAGFSRTNVYRMMAFYEAYPNCPTAVGQLESRAILMIPSHAFHLHNEFLYQKN